MPRRRKKKTYKPRKHPLESLIEKEAKKLGKSILNPKKKIAAPKKSKIYRRGIL